MHYRVCNFCEAMCGLAIEHDGKQVLSVKGDEKDPFSKGSICPKGAVIAEMYNDPDRLRKPLKKTSSGFVEIGWEEAFDIVGKRLNAIRKEQGNDAVGLYFGNPTVHNYGAMMYVADFKKTIRTKNNFSATSMDQLPHHFASQFMFGNGMIVPIPDINRTDYMIIMGANPSASNGSIMTAAGVQKRLRDIQQRGGKYIVIDPRKTETAKSADEHLFIVPGADVYFLLAMLHIITTEKKYNLKKLTSHVIGLDKVLSIATPYSPESVSSITGIAAEDIKRITDEYVNTEKAVLYGRMGVSTQEFGGLCNWLINLINILTGHFDTEGGAMFTNPAVPMVKNKVGHKPYNRWKSRVQGLPEFQGELPVSTMVEEMTTKGKGQIKALVTHAGNPVLSSPNGGRLDEALDQLEFMVSIDIYLNETTKHADIILPPTTGLEVDHYDLIFNSFAVSNTTKFSEALFPPKYGQLHDWQIFKNLTKRLSKKKLPLLYRVSTPKLLLKLALLNGPYGNLSSIKRLFTGLNLRKIKRSIHGIDLGPLVPMFPKLLRTEDQKIHLAPSLFLEQLEELHVAFSDGKNALADNEFHLIGRRHLRSNNSWMHNVDKLVSGKNRCTAMMNTQDAERLGLKEEDEVKVKSRVGEIKIPIELTKNMMPGVISIPHGFGHTRKGSQLKVAEAHAAGVSFNDISDHNRIDALTGNAAFSGQIVKVIT
ncbi:molybdopterin-dependent oxidoreductase [Aquimarina mytili]|uniref:Molybdopterin-dependent oxidoreductase n=2 Tax=Aquimarina mytili TaxID=874423 RepID=A0A936ZZT8_9FLAO|nr:molybdopterin-dependent oxidoreductase [Aquimarina mytili]